MLDGLSGELHPATAIALVEGSRYVRDAALSRRAGVAAPGTDAGDATGAWVQAIGGNSTLDGDYNTARTEANSNGLLVGLDREFSGWQVGVLAGTGRTDVKQQDRRAKSKIDNTHFGAMPATPGRFRPARWCGVEQARGEEYARGRLRRFQ